MGAKVIGIPMTAEGMNLELLEKNLYTYRPKLILLSAHIIHRNYYLSHRRQLLQLAELQLCHSRR